MKINFKGLEYEDADCVHIAQDADQFRVLISVCEGLPSNDCVTA
jgi:hypothetical protein